MPLTLYRYILFEVLKLLTVSLTVLVSVIAMALAIKPLADGLLNPVALVKFVFYSAPTILDIALPFAAAFASTLVFHRMTTDNEITACRASGMSYRMILLPVAVLGVVLMLVMFYLSSWVIPSFYRKAAVTLQQDMVRVVVKELEEGKPFRQRGMALYADRVGERELTSQEAATLANPDGVAPNRLVVLQGVAVGKLDEQGRLRNDATAEQADLLLFQDRDKSWVEIRLANAAYYSGSPDEPWGSAAQMTQRYDLPNPFENHLRFLRWTDLKKLADEPARLPQVANVRERLVEAMATEAAMRQMLTALAQGQGSLTMLGITEQQRYLLRAPVVERVGNSLRLTGDSTRPVELESYVAGLPRYRTRAQRGVLSTSYRDDALRLKLELEEVDVLDLRREGRRTQHKALPPLSPLRLAVDVAQPLQRTPTFALLERAARDYREVESVERSIEQTRYQIANLAGKQYAMLHGRAAAAVGAFFVLLLGAVLSLRLAGRLPLVIFFWSFAAAAVAVIITRSAESGLPHPLRGETLGALIIWSGNGLLGLLVAATGWKLSRH